MICNDPNYNLQKVAARLFRVIILNPRRFARYLQIKFHYETT